jgi:preprotein translocase subunit YajC
MEATTKFRVGKFVVYKGIICIITKVHTKRLTVWFRDNTTCVVCASSVRAIREA